MVKGMAEVESLRAFVHGHVQGVFFQDYVRKHAQALGLAGFVRNLPDGETVEVLAQGDKEKLNTLLKHLASGPRGARVERVEFEWVEDRRRFRQFLIVP